MCCVRDLTQENDKKSVFAFNGRNANLTDDAFGCPPHPPPTHTGTHGRALSRLSQRGVVPQGPADSIGSGAKLFVQWSHYSAARPAFHRPPALCWKSRLAPLRLHAAARGAWWGPREPGPWPRKGAGWVGTGPRAGRQAGGGSAR